MKNIYLLFILLSLPSIVFSQTLYVPSGSIGTSINGNVGIGINNPLDKLHVEGNLSIKAGSVNSPSFLDFTRTSDGWKAARIVQGYSNTGFAGHLTFETNEGATTTNLIERMRITHDGNVGIGTNNPLDKLHVEGNLSIKAGGVNSPSFLDFTRTSDGWKAARIVQGYSNTGFAGHLTFETNEGATTTNLIERMRITHDGNVGIGTNNPMEKLHVEGNLSIKASGVNSPSFLDFTRTSDGWKAARIVQGYSNTGFAGHLTFETNEGAATTNLIERMRITHDGNVGIGTNNPMEKLHVEGNLSIKASGVNSPSFLDFTRTSDGWKAARIVQGYSNTGFAGHLTFETNEGATTTNLIERMRITHDGNVGIGTSTTGPHRLAVHGSIGAREIKVEMTQWQDRVFHSNYDLKPLEQVEKYIIKNKHLSEIPSEKEVIENGINLGEMDAKLLQKIEELTLYLIEQNKKITEMKKEISALKNK